MLDIAIMLCLMIMWLLHHLLTYKQLFLTGQCITTHPHNTHLLSYVCVLVSVWESSAELLISLTASPFGVNCPINIDGVLTEICFLCQHGWNDLLAVFIEHAESCSLHKPPRRMLAFTLSLFALVIVSLVVPLLWVMMVVWQWEISVSNRTQWLTQWDLQRLWTSWFLLFFPVFFCVFYSLFSSKLYTWILFFERKCCF